MKAFSRAYFTRMLQFITSELGSFNAASIMLDFIFLWDSCMDTSMLENSVVFWTGGIPKIGIESWTIILSNRSLSNIIHSSQTLFEIGKKIKLFLIKHFRRLLEYSCKFSVSLDLPINFACLNYSWTVVCIVRSISVANHRIYNVIWSKNCTFVLSLI